MIGLKTLFWRWWYRHHPEPSRFTTDEAMDIASLYGQEGKVAEAIKKGCTPDEALQEWYIYPYDSVTKSK